MTSRCLLPSLPPSLPLCFLSCPFLVPLLLPPSSTSPCLTDVRRRAPCATAGGPPLPLSLPLPRRLSLFLFPAGGPRTLPPAGLRCPFCASPRGGPGDLNPKPFPFPAGGLRTFPAGGLRTLPAGGPTLPLLGLPLYTPMTPRSVEGTPLFLFPAGWLRALPVPAPSGLGSLPPPSPSPLLPPPPSGQGSRHLLPRVGADPLSPPWFRLRAAPPWAYRFLSDRPSPILADRDASQGRSWTEGLRPSRGTWE